MIGLLILGGVVVVVLACLTYVGGRVKPTENNDLGGPGWGDS